MNAGLHPFVVVFLRNVSRWPCCRRCWRGGGRACSTRRRSGFTPCALASRRSPCWRGSTALSLIPIGEVTAIGFLAPLFGTLGAIFLLGEKVRVRRWAALIVGFAGAMIILRPAATPLGLARSAPSCLPWPRGLTAVLIKQLTAKDDPGDKIVFPTNLMLLPLSLRCRRCSCGSGRRSPWCRR